MLNLLNREKRDLIRKEYFTRLLNVFLAIAIFSLIYYGILIFSNGMALSFQKKALDIETQNLATSSLQKDLEEYETTLSHLEIENNLFAQKRMLPTELLNLIMEKRLNGIAYDSISLNMGEGGIVRVEIRGKATNRDTLVTYSNSLKNESPFESVNIPVSSLAHSTDVPFSISMNFDLNKNHEE